jgi:hypothetical protein
VIFVPNYVKIRQLIKSLWGGIGRWTYQYDSVISSDIRKVGCKFNVFFFLRNSVCYIAYLQKSLCTPMCVSGAAVAQAVWCPITGWTIGVQSLTEAEDFSSSPASRPALGPTQPLIQWVPGFLSLGIKRGRGVTLTTHPHLVLRWRTSRSYTSSPPNPLNGV